MYYEKIMNNYNKLNSLAKIIGHLRGYGCVLEDI